ncbi:MAG: hypothetical protein Aureis2KO_13460 [Aureisphaera sp.]
MNRLYLFFIGALGILFIGCEEPLDYKYADKPLTLNCATIDKGLLKEAIYSFQDDIATFYKDPDILAGSKTAYIEAYKQFIFTGLHGDAPYAEIASPHSLAVLEKLKKIDDLWDRNRKGTNLNYTGEFMSCIFGNIRDEDLKNQFATILEVDYLTPQIMAEPMRQQVAKIFNDEHLAMYIAMDAFYQQLLNSATENE